MYRTPCLKAPIIDEQNVLHIIGIIVRVGTEPRACPRWVRQRSPEMIPSECVDGQNGLHRVGTEPRACTR